MTHRLIRVGLLIAGSGFAALIYQIVWMRELRLVFGASTAATAAVTAVFMGGLGAGSAILGHRADRSRQPMMRYAGLEAIIACLALLSPVLIAAARTVYMAAGGTMAMGMVGGTVVRLLLSAVILGGATVAMGGTLPAVVRALQTADDADRKQTALLYGMNTAGAVIGVMAATFWMIEVFGLRNTLYIAALVNLLVVVAARQMARRMPASAVAAAPDAGAPRPSGGSAGRSPVPPGFIYLAAFTTGFVFFLMELVWYRLLSPILGGTTYSFGLILAVALSGIGLGGGLYALVGGAAAGGLGVFAVTCGVEAVLLAVPYLLGDWVGVFAALIQPLTVLGLKGQILSWGLVTLVVVFPASVVAGYQFPLLIALLGRGKADIGRHTGNAYAFNTAGAITGTLAGGFGLMTALSAPGCWRLAVYMMLALCLAAVFLAGPRPGRRLIIAVSAAAALVVVMIGAGGPTAAWRHAPIGAGRLPLAGSSLNEIRNLMSTFRRNVFWEMDGKESAIGMDRSNGLAFVVNGKIDGNAISDAPTQVMGGLIGAAIHPEPKRSLVIGLGTGSTAGWLARVPSMTRVDVVEIEPGIVAVAEACRAVNQDVLDNPKVEIIFDDAREVLMTTEKTYDLIFSEPSNPYRAGIASLYTTEFYREAAKRMAPGGIFMQWVQAYEIAPRTIKSIYVTLASVFPYIDTWETKADDIVLVCSLSPLLMDRSRLAPRLAAAPFDSALRHTWHVGGVEGFLSRYVANAAFAQWLAMTPHPQWWLNTDDRMQIEFDFARTVGRQHYFPIAEMKAMARNRGQDRPLIDHAAVDWDRVQGDGLVSRLLDTGNNRLAADPAFSQRARVEAYGWFVQSQFGPLQDMIAEGRFAPDRLLDYMVTAMARARAGDPRALADIGVLRQTQPTDAEAIAAVYHWTIEDTPAALYHLEQLLRRLQRDPWAERHCVMAALEIAPALARLRPADIAPLMQGLAEPFAAGMLTDFRLRLILRVASLGGFSPGAEALAAFEPHVPWEADFLTYRRDAYRVTANPLLERAEQDLDRFKESAPTPLADFIDHPAGKTPQGRPGGGDEGR